MALTRSFCLQFCLALLLFNSCDRKYNEVPFSEKILTGTGERMLCLVLNDSTLLSQIEYFKLLQHCRVSHRPIFSVIDISSNEAHFLKQVLQPTIYPTTCVFDENGALIDIIPGFTSESILSLKEIIHHKKPLLDFHFNHIYGKDKLQLINLIDNILLLRREAIAGRANPSEIDSLFSLSKNPTILYSGILNSTVNSNEKDKKKYASLFLSQQSADYFINYHDEIIAANLVLDSLYNDEGPKLFIEKSSIDLGDIPLSRNKQVIIPIKNDGQRQLIIAAVSPGCGCLKHYSDIPIELSPSESNTISLFLVPDNKGRITRDVYIVSNSIDSPIKKINITANIY